jgi:MoaA/NifB/PqqE/SkfB family radical SAM enzyme
MENKLRITTENRTRLETVIPLSTPYLVFIDPCNICNQQCKYCPTGNRDLIRKIGRKQTVMEFDLFRKIIDQFAGFSEKVKTLRLYKDGEPLLNPRFTDMVRYAKDSGYFKQIDTTTNGRLLTEKLSRMIILSGLDKVFISVPTDYDKNYVDNVKYLYANSRDNLVIFTKIAGDFISKNEQQRFMDTFSGICDSAAIEHTAPCWPGFEVEGINKEVGIYGQPVQPDIKVCPYVFYTLSINADGTVDHCFVDWKHDVLLGDLRHDNVVDVWNGQRLYNIRREMLLGNRDKLPNCGVCEHHMYGQPDNIDEYAEELLRRL